MFDKNDIVNSSIDVVNGFLSLIGPFNLQQCEIAHWGILVFMV